jgi:hypothetical protein
MRKLADHACFLNEALPGLAARQVARQQFDGYGARYERIEAARHFAFGARANDLKNLITADLQIDLSEDSRSLEF